LVIINWYAKHPTTKKRGSYSIEQDLSRLVPGSVITLDDRKLENDDDDDDDDDDAGSAPSCDGRLGS
jgi:hypothetical protein